MNRGSDRQAIFRTPADRLDFLALVGQLRERWGVETHAFCLMTNHYHLMIQDVRGCLSEAVRHLDGVHAQRFNRRTGRDGPLFRGRFRSRLVQTEGYVAELARYIHRNPIEAGLVESAAEYPWSSHRHYLSDVDRPWWLEVEFVGCEEPGRTKLDGLDEFVHDTSFNTIRSHTADPSWTPILGDEEFVKLWRARLVEEDLPDDDQVPDRRRLVARRADEVLSAATVVFGVERKELVTRTSSRLRNLPRSLALAACRRFTRLPGAEVGALFGLRASAVYAASAKVERLIEDDATVRGWWRELETELALQAE